MSALVWLVFFALFSWNWLLCVVQDFCKTSLKLSLPKVSHGVRERRIKQKPDRKSTELFDGIGVEEATSSQVSKWPWKEIRGASCRRTYTPDLEMGYGPNDIEMSEGQGKII